MSKKINKVKVSFPGTSSEEVTGSMVLIETKTKKILVECGLWQGSGTLLQEYKNNSKRFPFKAKEINYVILLHGHADHTMRVPLLYKRGCEADIISPIGLKSIYKAMGEDSAFIIKRNSDDLSKKFNKEYEPIYDREDVLNSLRHWKEYPLNQKIQIDEDIEIRFIESGHIINACQCELWVKNNNRTVKIGITSDLGNTKVKQYYTNEFKPIEKANLLIGECTYGDTARGIKKADRKKDLEKIKTIIETYCVERKGKVLIPCFALQRGQAILTHLYNIFGKNDDFDVPIIIDSALMLKMNDVFLQELQGPDYECFEEVMNWKNIRRVEDFLETSAWVNSNAPAIFVSCGGMLQAGRAVYTATKLLQKEDSCIIFCGYSVEGSLGWKIKNATKNHIRIDGKNVPCRCNVIDLKSFSNHMQREELLDYYSSGNYDKICLVHGEMNTKLAFAEELQEELHKKNKTNKVCVVNKSTVLNI